MNPVVSHIVVGIVGFVLGVIAHKRYAKPANAEVEALRQSIDRVKGGKP
jgi:pyrimidine deaminase RibD-like protein